MLIKNRVAAFFPSPISFLLPLIQFLPFLTCFYFTLTLVSSTKFFPHEREIKDGPPVGDTKIDTFECHRLCFTQPPSGRHCR